MTWRARFAEPVPVGGGKPLRTLSDARAYILALPADQQEQERWQTAAETLLHAAEHGGAWMDFARIGMMQALNGGPKGRPEPRPGYQPKRRRR